MPNLREYWQGVATKAGTLTEEQIKAIGESLGDDKVAEVFQSGFVTRSDYSRDLDKQRDKLSGENKELVEKNQKLVKWWKETAQPAYQANLQGVESLKRYHELFGDLPDGNGKPNPDTLTKETNTVSREQLDEALAVQGQNYVNLTKMAMIVGGNHTKVFGTPLSADELNAVEKVAVDNGIPLDKAYDLYINPRVREKETAELTAKYEKKTEEAVRDALSKHNLPVDPKPPEPHPFFNRPDTTEPKDALEARQRSKEEFTAGWNEGAPGSAG